MRTPCSVNANGIEPPKCCLEGIAFCDTSYALVLIAGFFKKYKIGYRIFFIVHHSKRVIIAGILVILFRLKSTTFALCQLPEN